jgi:tRNA threonylcarbamoyladenosine biosynthesis protein TsaE
MKITFHEIENTARKIVANNPNKVILFTEILPEKLLYKQLAKELGVMEATSSPTFL